MAYPIDESIRTKTHEIETLNALRDTLLGKLISGELRIPDTERIVGEQI
jgi:type I restriction enzyme, S subunit